MADIASAWAVFARRWNTASALRNEPDAFRADANTVVRRVHERMLREDREFYPAIEASSA